MKLSLLGIFLILTSLGFSIYWAAGANPNKVLVLPICIIAIFVGMFFTLHDRAIEITFKGIGKIKAAAKQAAIDAAAIAEIKKSIEAQAATVDLIAKSATEANERAAEANQELVKIKAPRTLSLEQQNRIVEKLKKFPATTFVAITYPGEPEPAAFTNILTNVLVLSEWCLNPNNSKGSLLGLASGVVIVVGKEAGANAEMKGKALVEALISEGIEAKLGYDSLQINPVAIEIKIQIAKKP